MNVCDLIEWRYTFCVSVTWLVVERKHSSNGSSIGQEYLENNNDWFLRKTIWMWSKFFFCTIKHVMIIGHCCSCYERDHTVSHVCCNCLWCIYLFESIVIQFVSIGNSSDASVYNYKLKSMMLILTLVKSYCLQLILLPLD